MKKYIIITIILVIILFIIGCEGGIRKTGLAGETPVVSATASVTTPVSTPTILPTASVTTPVSTPTILPTVVPTLVATATPSPECDEAECNKKDGWYKVGGPEWKKVAECKDEERVLEEERNYYCNRKGECVFKYTGFLGGKKTRWTPTGRKRNWPDGTDCNPPGSWDDGFCKGGICLEKSCDNLHGNDKKEPCPKGSTAPRECCGPEYQCCHASGTNPGCCLKAPYQKCSELDLGWTLNYNVCVDLFCPDETSSTGEKMWYMCGDPTKTSTIKNMCCKKEKYCTADDRMSGRCGDTCSLKLERNIYVCSHTGSCPTGYQKYPTSGNPVNYVCCKTGFETPIHIGEGIWKCRRDKCEEGQTICRGMGDFKDKENACCDPGFFCYHDVSRFPRCKSLTGDDPVFPWPKGSPLEPALQVSAIFDSIGEGDDTVTLVCTWLAEEITVQTICSS